METTLHLVSYLPCIRGPKTSSEVELMETIDNNAPESVRGTPQNFFGSWINGNEKENETVFNIPRAQNFFGSWINGNG